MEMGSKIEKALKALEEEEITSVQLGKIITYYDRLKKFVTIQIRDEFAQRLIKCMVQNIDGTINYFAQYSMDPTLISFLNDCFDVTIAVLNTDKLNNEYVLQGTQKILDMVIEADVQWWKKPLLKFFINLLQKSSKPVRLKTAKVMNIYYLYKLVDLFCSCGDYDLQMATIQTIFALYDRKYLVSTSKINPLFPESQDLNAAFFDITNKNFNRRVRVFLNRLNDASRKVLSLVCKQVSLGQRVCFPPHGLKQINGLWIDFNSAESSISWYCSKVGLLDDHLFDEDCEYDLITLFISDVLNVNLETNNERNTKLIIFQLKNACITTYPETQKVVEKAKTLLLELDDTEKARQFIKIVLQSLSKNLSTENADKSSAVAKPKHTVLRNTAKASSRNALINLDHSLVFTDSTFGASTEKTFTISSDLSVGIAKVLEKCSSFHNISSNGYDTAQSSVEEPIDKCSAPIVGDADDFFTSREEFTSLQDVVMSPEKVEKISERIQTVGKKGVFKSEILVISSESSGSSRPDLEEKLDVRSQLEELNGMFELSQLMENTEINRPESQDKDVDGQEEAVKKSSYKSSKSLGSLKDIDKGHVVKVESTTDTALTQAKFHLKEKKTTHCAKENEIIIIEDDVLMECSPKIGLQNESTVLNNLEEGSFQKKQKSRQIKCRTFTGKIKNSFRNEKKHRLVAKQGKENQKRKPKKKVILSKLSESTTLSLGCQIDSEANELKNMLELPQLMTHTQENLLESQDKDIDRIEKLSQRKQSLKNQSTDRINDVSECEDIILDVEEISEYKNCKISQNKNINMVEQLSIQREDLLETQESLDIIDVLEYAGNRNELIEKRAEFENLNVRKDKDINNVEILLSQCKELLKTQESLGRIDLVVPECKDNIKNCMKNTSELMSVSPLARCDTESLEPDTALLMLGKATSQSNTSLDNIDIISEEEVSVHQDNEKEDTFVMSPIIGGRHSNPRIIIEGRERLTNNRNATGNSVEQTLEIDSESPIIKNTLWKQKKMPLKRISDCEEDSFHQNEEEVKRFQKDVEEIFGQSPILGKKKSYLIMEADSIQYQYKARHEEIEDKSNESNELLRTALETQSPDPRNQTEMLFDELQTPEEKQSGNLNLTDVGNVSAVKGFCGILPIEQKKGNKVGTCREKIVPLKIIDTLRGEIKEHAEEDALATSLRLAQELSKRNELQDEFQVATDLDMNEYNVTPITCNEEQNTRGHQCEKEFDRLLDESINKLSLEKCQFFNSDDSNSSEARLEKGKQIVVEKHMKVMNELQSKEKKNRCKKAKIKIAAKALELKPKEGQATNKEHAEGDALATSLRLAQELSKRNELQDEFQVATDLDMNEYNVTPITCNKEQNTRGRQCEKEFVRLLDESINKLSLEKCQFFNSDDSNSSEARLEKGKQIVVEKHMKVLNKLQSKEKKKRYKKPKIEIAAKALELKPKEGQATNKIGNKQTRLSEIQLSGRKRRLFNLEESDIIHVQVGKPTLEVKQTNRKKIRLFGTVQVHKEETQMKKKGISLTTSETRTAIPKMQDEINVVAEITENKRMTQQKKSPMSFEEWFSYISVRARKYGMQQMPSWQKKYYLDWSWLKDKKRKSQKKSHKLGRLNQRIEQLK